jgi:hypothetical protein
VHLILSSLAIVLGQGNEQTSAAQATDNPPPKNRRSRLDVKARAGNRYWLIYLPKDRGEVENCRVYMIIRPKRLVDLPKVQTCP